MSQKVVKRSLRSKILVVLVALPVLSLSLFLSMASDLYVKDKTSYVFDTTAQNAAILANDVRLSYKKFHQNLKNHLDFEDSTQTQFSRYSQRQFIRQSTIEYIYLFAENEGKMEVVDQLVLPTREIRKPQLKSEVYQKVFSQLQNEKQILVDFPNRSRFFIYGQQMKSAKTNSKKVLLAFVKIPQLYEAFSTPGLFASYLVGQDLKTAIRPKFWRASKKDTSTLQSNVFKKAFQVGTPQGVFEHPSSDGETLLVAFSDVGFGNYYTFSVIKKSKALQAYEMFLLKAGLFFIAVISAVVLIGFFLSTRLTSALSRVIAMTREIAGGQFSISSTIKTNDEIEELADNIIHMGQEVHSLLEEKVELSRMEGELGMVNVVQKSLFPEQSFRQQTCDIEVRLEPATEAGGDWCHYSKVEDKLIVWIGDATGHGAPAALVTAAAKSASSLIELNGSADIRPGEIMRQLNHAVRSTTKGTVMMTFFVGVIDLKTGLLEYANASHEPPIILPPKADLKKKDIGFLVDAKGKRLGEQDGSEYKEASYQLKAGDTLVFYTDGITDLENPEGKAFGEGRFVRTLAKIAHPDDSAGEFADHLQLKLNEYRKGCDLKDDMMYIVCRYDSNLSKQQAS